MVVRNDSQPDQARSFARTFADVMEDLVGIQEVGIAFTQFAEAYQCIPNIEQCQALQSSISDLAQKPNLLSIGPKRSSQVIQPRVPSRQRCPAICLKYWVVEFTCLVDGRLNNTCK